MVTMKTNPVTLVIYLINPVIKMRTKMFTPTKTLVAMRTTHPMLTDSQRPPWQASPVQRPPSDSLVPSQLTLYTPSVPRLVPPSLPLTR